MFFYYYKLILVGRQQQQQQQQKTNLISDLSNPNIEAGSSSPASSHNGLKTSGVSLLYFVNGRVIMILYYKKGIFLKEKLKFAYKNAPALDFNVQQLVLSIEA